MPTITEEFLEQGSSGPGSWNREQFDTLGFNPDRKKFTPEPGWKKRVIGRFITEEKWNRFLSLKGQSRKKKKRNETIQMEFV